MKTICLVSISKSTNKSLWGLVWGALSGNFTVKRVSRYSCCQTGKIQNIIVWKYTVNQEAISCLFEGGESTKERRERKEDSQLSEIRWTEKKHEEEPEATKQDKTSERKWVSREKGDEEIWRWVEFKKQRHQVQICLQNFLIYLASKPASSSWVYVYVCTPILQHVHPYPF